MTDTKTDELTTGMANLAVAEPNAVPNINIIPAAYRLFDKKYSPEAFGLTNTGSICWCNSALQILLSCTALNQMMLENEAILKTNQVAYTYIEIIKKLIPIGDGPRPVLTDFRNSSILLLNSMLKELKRLDRKSDLSGVGQKDPDEGIHMFLDLVNYPPVENLFKHRYTSSSYCNECKAISYSNNDLPPNIVMDLEIKKTITNGAEFATYLKMHVTLNDKLKCEKCGKEAINSFIIYKLRMIREIIVIRIKNTNSGLLSRNLISYPEQLEFTNANGTANVYQLVGQIDHLGEQRMIQTTQGLKSYMSSGHYVAKCYRGDKYYTCNDTNVAESKFEVSTNAYVLVYNLVKL